MDNPDAEKSKAKAAAAALIKNGFVILDDVIAPKKIDSLYCQLRESHSGYFDENFLSENEDNLCVGHKRYVFNPKLTGVFADPEVYANSKILEVARRVLGYDTIIESFGVIISFPGSETQHIHRDGPPLYSGGIARLLPPFALTVAIPLVDMNENFGNTAFWPGSHLEQEEQDDLNKSVAPCIPIGSSGIWDFRVFHAGLPNKSSMPRPIIYITYAKSWWRDIRNFSRKGQRRISFDRELLETVEEEAKPLFAHLRCLADGWE